MFLVQCSRKLQKACCLSDTLGSLVEIAWVMWRGKKVEEMHHSRPSRIGGPEGTNESDSKRGGGIKMYLSEQEGRNKRKASEGGQTKVLRSSDKYLNWKGIMSLPKWYASLIPRQSGYQ